MSASGSHTGSHADLSASHQSERDNASALPDSSAKFVNGDVVEARFGRAVQWVRGRIVKVHSGDVVSYDINYMNGESERRVSCSLVRAYGTRTRGDSETTPSEGMSSTNDRDSKVIELEPPPSFLGADTRSLASLASALTPEFTASASRSPAPQSLSTLMSMDSGEHSDHDEENDNVLMGTMNTETKRDMETLSAAIEGETATSEVQKATTTTILRYLAPCHGGV